jgi:hypothetical protein
LPAVSYQYDINGNILNKSDVGDYSYNNVNSTHPHTPNSIAGSGSNTAATEVLSGDGGVITTSCLYFLVTASIGTVGEGCRVCAFSELLWFVEGCPSNGFIAIFGHAAHISGLSEGFTYDALDRLTQSSTTGKIDGVDYNYAVSYQYDIIVSNGLLLGLLAQLAL